MKEYKDTRQWGNNPLVFFSPQQGDINSAIPLDIAKGMGKVTEEKGKLYIGGIRTRLLRQFPINYLHLYGIKGLNKRIMLEIFPTGLSSWDELKKILFLIYQEKDINKVKKLFKLVAWMETIG